jgi:hypothetical protein
LHLPYATALGLHSCLQETVILRDSTPGKANQPRQYYEARERGPYLPHDKPGEGE